MPALSCLNKIRIHRLPAYVVYSMQKLQQMPGVPLGQRHRILGEKWNKIPEKRKAIWQRKADALNAKRLAKAASGQLSVRILKPKMQNVRAENYVTAYSVFSRIKFASIKKSNRAMPSPDIFREVAKLWQSFTPRERMRYERKAEKQKKAMIAARAPKPEAATPVSEPLPSPDKAMN